MMRIIPGKFGSRLLLMALFAGLMPVVIFALLIHTSSDRFKSEINQAVQSGRDLEWRRGEVVLRQQGEERGSVQKQWTWLSSSTSCWPACPG